MKYRIKDREKFQRFIILNILFVSILSFILIASFTSNIVSGNAENTHSIVVRQGDTVWSIASKIDTERDIRELVHEIQSKNTIVNSNIRPGQKLIIPTH